MCVCFEEDTIMGKIWGLVWDIRWLGVGFGGGIFWLLKFWRSVGVCVFGEGCMGVNLGGLVGGCRGLFCVRWLGRGEVCLRGLRWCCEGS